MDVKYVLIETCFMHVHVCDTCMTWKIHDLSMAWNTCDTYVAYSINAWHHMLVNFPSIDCAFVSLSMCESLLIDKMASN